ncbi:MAG: 2-oxoacid:acceptor oxidoreductase family protein, partial [Candidatus Latescibacteria bacterium]|nr:2-oxoacid:acceptor oxidoreductase family protein [Candidatus Latescibacterota bacterium]
DTPADRNQLIKCAGFGGQGILALGEIIAITAMWKGKNVSWLPSYGPESRGGTCNCDVILADEEIAAPVVENPTVAFIFNQPSMDKFEPQVALGGVMLYDTSLAEIQRERDGIDCVGVPFTTMARELGSDKVANMVALGAYIGHIGYLDLDSSAEAMRQKFMGKEAFFEINEKAIVAGMNFVATDQ